MTYTEEKSLTLECYDDAIEEGKESLQAVAETLEDSVLSMLRDQHAYFAVIINLSILSIKKGEIPDYLFERCQKNKKVLDQNILKSNDYQLDWCLLRELMSKNNFNVVKEESYKARVDMLLSEVE